MAKRNSSIELLRVLSMISVVAVHYLGNNDLGNLANSFSLEGECFIVIKTIFNYGVNIFVIITGYYMCGKTSVSVRKAVKLLFDVTFYGICMYFLGVVLGVNSLGVSDFIKSAVPILAGHLWFVKAYLVLFFLSPFVGKLVNYLSRKAHLALIAISMSFFSFWPSFLPNPPSDDYGFSFINFLLLFIIAGYFRKYLLEINTTICTLVFIGCSFVTITVQSFRAAGITIYGLNTFVGYSLAHNSPFNIASCFALFFLFAKHEFYSKTINILAASSFAVYLIHGNPYMMKFVFNNLLLSLRFENNFLWIPHMLISCILIYLVCFLIDIAKKHSIDIFVNRILDKVKVFNFIINA